MAILRARESARQIACGNSMRQLGLAISQYEAQHRAFPIRSTNRYSAFALLLPHLDQQPLYSKIDFSNADEAEFPTNRLNLPLLQCPSSSRIETGGSNYVCCFGTGAFTGGPNGIFGHVSLRDTSSPIRHSMVTDGLSNTVALSETQTGDLGPRYFGSIAYLEVDSVTSQNFDSLATQCIETRLTEAQERRLASNWLFAGAPRGVLYNHVLPPNSMSCSIGGTVIHGAYSASSGHQQGVQTLFADGSVHLISSSISKLEWRALGSRNSSELNVD